MTRPPCGAFEAGVIRHRCIHCGWAKSRHNKRVLCSVTGKIRHRTRASAAKQLNQIVVRKKADRDPQTLMAYLCEHCREWHVGHSSGGTDDIATSNPLHQRSGGEL